MRKLLFVITFLSPLLTIAQLDGEQLFSIKCAACHTIGKGKLVGPDLLNVQQKASSKWLHSFIKSSQSVIRNGDKQAAALQKEYDKVVMPDQSLSDSQITSLLAYIGQQSTPQVAGEQNTISSSGNKTPGTSPQQSPETKSADSLNTGIYFSTFSISIAAFFFLVIIWALSVVINTLCKALGEEYKKNKHSLMR